MCWQLSPPSLEALVGKVSAIALRVNAQYSLSLQSAIVNRGSSAIAGTNFYTGLRCVNVIRHNPCKKIKTTHDAVLTVCNGFTHNHTYASGSVTKVVRQVVSVVSRYCVTLE